MITNSKRCGICTGMSAGLVPLKDLVHEKGALPEQVRIDRAVGHQPAGHSVILGLKHAGQPILRQEVDDPLDVVVVERIAGQQYGIRPLARQYGERDVEVVRAARLDRRKREANAAAPRRASGRE